MKNLFLLTTHDLLHVGLLIDQLTDDIHIGLYPGISIFAVMISREFEKQNKTKQTPSPPKKAKQKNKAHVHTQNCVCKLKKTLNQEFRGKINYLLQNYSFD